MSISSAHADSFYTEAAKGGRVWALRDDGGFIAPLNSEGVRAMPFWSKRSRAERISATVAAYAGLEPVAIALAEFRNRWLVGLAHDGLLVGLNWSGDRATGYDVEPADVEAGLASRE